MDERYRVSFTEIDDYGRSDLVIEHDGLEIGRYSDRGEPEDNLFCRDWDWVSVELERAYKLGMSDIKEIR